MSLEALKNKAKKAALAGKYDAALKAYSEIHKEAPTDLRMSTKLAEMKEKTGDLKGAVQEYTLIAKQYADEGFVVQAIAINKLILRLDPEQTSIKERLRDLSTERGEDWALSTIISSDIALQSKSPNTSNLERTPLLSGLSGQELDDFIECLELRDFKDGESIYKQGDPGDTLYIIGMGNIHLETANARGNTQTFSKLNEGDFFGEMAFMDKKNHVDTAIANSDGNVLLFHRNVFDEWIQKYPSINDTLEDFYKRRVLARILAITPIFENIPNKARQLLAQQFDFATFSDGEIIIQENDVESTFFLIRSGKVTISTTNKKESGKILQLGKLGEGSFFGEVSMLTKMPRTATVSATGAVELLTLTSEKFLEIAKLHPSAKQVVEAYLKQRVKNTIKKMNDHS